MSRKLIFIPPVSGWTEPYSGTVPQQRSLPVFEPVIVSHVKQKQAIITPQNPSNESRTQEESGVRISNLASQHVITQQNQPPIELTDSNIRDDVTRSGKVSIFLEDAADLQIPY